MGRAGDAPAAVFGGRSNAGKSSALNAICGGGFARTARTPGRTRAANIFQLPGGQLLADLPGYGYAAVAKKEREQWQEKLPRFLMSPNIRCAVLAVDCRRGVQPRDVLFLQMVARPSLLLLNKSDKLGRTAMRQCMRESESALRDLSCPATLLEFSSLKKIGAEEARRIISGWLAE